MANIRNVVVVVVDALRADRVDAIKGDRGLTPNIDSLASDGTAFTSAFACTNTTDASVTSLMTGRHPRASVYHHGPLVTQTEKQRIEAITTLPEHLRASGWQTVATGRPMGRWHTNGYDAHPHVSETTPTLHKVGDALNRIDPRIRSVATSVYKRLRRQTAQPDARPTAVDDLLEHVGDEPLFGFVHLMDTHIPYVDDDELVEEMLEVNEYPEGELEPILAELGDDAPLVNSLRSWLEDRDYERGLARVCARYDASVVHADRKVGALVEGLSAAGELDETAIFVLSDHGESLVEHGIYFDHHGLYDSSIHVPLVCHFPGESPDTVDEFVQLVDVAPSVLDICGLETPSEMDGQSLVPLLSGDGTWNSRTAVFAEEAHTQRRVAIRTAEWKLIEHREDEELEDFRGDSLRCGYCFVDHDDPPVLFALSDTADETRDLAEQHPQRVEELASALRDWESSVSPQSAIDEETAVEYEGEEVVMERLKDLGYR